MKFQNSKKYQLRKKEEWNRNVIKTSFIVTEQDLGQFME